MVTLFSTLKIKHNGRLCHLLSACQVDSLCLSASSKNLTYLQHWLSVS